jgi:hypothetical protein
MLRRIMILAVLGLATTGLYSKVSCKGANSHSFKVQDLFTLNKDDDERRERLERKRQRLANQIAMSDMVVTNLIDGQISLSDAIEELDQINCDRAFDPSPKTPRTGATRKEEIAHYALNKAEYLLEHNFPSRWKKELTRMRAEFLAMFGSVEFEKWK